MENEVMNLAEKTVSALETTLQAVEPYVPTKYVDYSEPDIDAEHLNHAENAIKLATDALNLAISTINTLSSAVDQLNRDMTVITGQAKPWSAKVTTNNCKRIGKIAFCEIWAFKESGALIAQESLFSLPWKPESTNMHICAVGRNTSTGITIPIVADIDDQYGVVRVNQNQDLVNEIRFYLVYLVAN